MNQASKAEEINEHSRVEKSCGYQPRPYRIEARHIESNGVGYKQGYSTLEGFFAMPRFSDPWTPFLDLRGHVFNNGKMAANAGLGIRYTHSRVWGVNAYYDYRNTHRMHYNQVSAGLESLGEFWDFRLNGYLPVGRKGSHFYHTRFSRFRGNHMIVSQRQEGAMKGLNAEAGYHVLDEGRYTLYLAAGPYYFQWKDKHAVGGELRAVAQVTDYLRFQVNTSYDTAFHGIVQGEMGIVWPLGRKHPIKKAKQSCSRDIALAKRAVQRVDRNEIIVLDKRRKHSVAINPNTGDPFVFWFVDNTSHSNGTFESPFNTLAAAQNSSQSDDVIYVFPGDGTTTGMSSGIVLKNNQRLFGAGIAQTLRTTQGTITIPQFASSNPLISDSTSSVNSAVVNLANNCEVSGISMQATQQFGVFGNAINRAYIHNNEVNELAGASGVGISIQNYVGVITVDNNAVSSSSDFAGGIVLSTPISTASWGTITNNTVNNANTRGISAVQTQTGVANHVTMSGNTVTNSQQGIGVLQQSLGTGMTVNITNNTTTSQTDYGTVVKGGIVVENAANVVGGVCVNIQSNTCNISPSADPGFKGFVFNNLSTNASLMNLSSFNGNTGTVDSIANPMFTSPTCP